MKITQQERALARFKMRKEIYWLQQNLFFNHANRKALN